MNFISQIFLYLLRIFAEMKKQVQIFFQIKGQLKNCRFYHFMNFWVFFSLSAEYLAISSLAWKVLSDLKKNNYLFSHTPTEHERSCFQNPYNFWMLHFRLHVALIKRFKKKPFIPKEEDFYTSLQWSVSVLYTYNFKGRPSWASIKVKRSSDSWRTESAPMIYNEFITCFH